MPRPRLQITAGAFPLGIGISEALDHGQLQTIAAAQAQLQVGRIREAFRAGGHHRRGGTQWAPLRPRVVRRRARRGRTTILIDTGRLRNTIFGTAEVSHGAYGASVTLRITAPAPYARFHQNGTATMPARPPLEFTTQDAAQIAESIKAQADRLLMREGV